MNNVLDDSLTSIQWLCQLESNRILENKRPAIYNKHSVKSEKPAPENPYPKPHHSYATLIVLAINSSLEKRMTLQEIYSWIQENYPYYRLAKKGWKNSIRHNLSLHKFFIKEKRPTVLHGKGSFWRISPEGKENLMKDLFMQNNPNLQTPYTFLPHDPHRKLRPIMPKPEKENPTVQYVPYLPVMFVPGNIPSGPPTACDQVGMSMAEIEVIAASMELEKENQATTSGIVEDEIKVLPKDKCDVTHCTSAEGKTNKERALKTRQLPNILRRRKKIREKSPVKVEKASTPKQPTLAAINSQLYHGACSPKQHDTSTLRDLVSSPLRYHNTSFDFFNGLSSPGFSPLCSPSQFKTGLTPIKSDTNCDSGIMMTPLKTGYNDLSWTPFKTGFTPITSSPQQHSTSSLSCRKQLGLD